jgi:hypothetical protein
MAKTVVSARLDIAYKATSSFVVLITRFGCQIVEMSQLRAQRALCPRIAVPYVWVMLVRTVAAVIVLAFTGMVSENRDDTFIGLSIGMHKQSIYQLVLYPLLLVCLVSELTDKESGLRAGLAQRPAVNECKPTDQPLLSAL